MASDREGKENGPDIGKGGNEPSGLREGRERALGGGGSEERKENGGACTDKKEKKIFLLYKGCKVNI